MDETADSPAGGALLTGALYLDGAWKDAADGRTFAVTDPATGEIIGRVAEADRCDAASAVQAAVAAFELWAARTAYQRADFLTTAHRLMLERADDLALLMTREQGKPLKMARNEVRYG